MLTHKSQILAASMAMVLGATACSCGAGFENVDLLLSQKKYAQAVELLRSATIDDDIYPCSCNDAPHHHRSAGRRLCIVDCLLKLNKKDEARAELRSLFESRVDPAYIIPDKADLLLIDLESANGYHDFELWIDKHLPVTPKDYARSFKHIVALKKAIENGDYDGTVEILRGIDAYNVYVAPRTLMWQEEAVVTYMTRNPQSLPYLLDRLPNAANVDMNKGLIYCIGATGSPKAVPALLEARRTATNYYVLLEITMALAKCSHKPVAPDLFKMRRGNLAHQQMVDHLLRDLTGKAFGPIKSEADAEKVYSGWSDWIRKEYGAQAIMRADAK